VAVAILSTACESSSQNERKPKAPRPVTVLLLHQTTPASQSLMTGSVGAWKTEKIGFEISGRVARLLEPETEIEGRVVDQQNGKVLVPGTILARLHDEQYRIAVDLARAAMDVAIQRKKAMDVEIAEGIPARLASAKAEQQLAEADSKRTISLVNKKVATRSEYDRAMAEVLTANAGVANIEAELKTRKAELRSQEAEIEKARFQLAEAERNLRDTVLYSSFRGQVAHVEAVPGSYLDAGDPALTIQIMDPIKVELELSASMSRNFRRGDTVRLYAGGRNDQGTKLEGYVYMTDPNADAETRTFTVTLLVRNRKTQLKIPAEYQSERIARTKDIWPLNFAPIVQGGNMLMTEENAIRHDAEGAFLWKITNRRASDVSHESSRVLNVEKIRITPGNMRIPFLGNWNFVPVTVQKGENIDPENDLVAGELTVSQGKPDQWDGTHILLDESSWLLRPGDTVRVSLQNEEGKPGLYVPMKAVRHHSGKTSIFIIEQDSEAQTIAREIEVILSDKSFASSQDTLLRQIRPAPGFSLPEHAQVVLEGMPFLSEGEPVTIVRQPEVIR
tara:strand:- start:45430 stop:47112 length:1683 start_codon:yes stop_codon:yes gene_type:complete